MKNKISRKLFAVIMALCVVFAYTGFAFADTVEEMTTPGTEAEVTEPVVEEEPVEGTEEPAIEIEEEETEEEPIEVPEPKAKKAVVRTLSEEPVEQPVLHFTPNGNHHEVSIDGESKVVFCIQHDYVWPDENIGYRECNISENLGLSDEQIGILTKVLYAGYPNDAVGILANMSDFWTMMYTDKEESAKEYVTAIALWYFLEKWGIAGNEVHPVNGAVHEYGMVSPIDGSKSPVDEIIDYATSTDVITPPAKNEIVISGEGELTKVKDIWTTGSLSITEPSGYKLEYSFEVPDGVKVVDADGNEISHIIEGTAFRITAENKESIADGAKITVTATAKYPTDLKFYATDEYIPHPNPTYDGQVFNYYQAMMGISVASKTLTGELALSIKPETPVIPTPGGNITPPSPTPDDEDSKVDDATEETPVTPEEPSADEEDDDSIDSDPMGDLELMSDSDDEDAEADEAEEDISADPMGVKTGDATDMLIYLAFFLISVLMLCGCIAYTKKIRKE